MGAPESLELWAGSGSSWGTSTPCAWKKAFLRRNQEKEWVTPPQPQCCLYLTTCCVTLNRSTCCFGATGNGARGGGDPACDYQQSNYHPGIMAPQRPLSGGGEVGPLAAGKGREGGTLGITPGLRWGGLETGRGRLGKVARLALGREQRTRCLSEERLARRWGAAVRGLAPTSIRDSVADRTLGTARVTPDTDSSWGFQNPSLGR